MSWGFERELPAITSSNLLAAAVNQLPAITVSNHALRALGGLQNYDPALPTRLEHQLRMDQLSQQLRNVQPDERSNMASGQTNGRRIVQVFILDRDRNVPTQACELYKSGQFVTDATDQELYFDIDLKDILSRHNSYRTTLTGENGLKLKPIRIRDLAMHVVTIASFWNG